MANVAQCKIPIYIGECGPIAVKEPGQAAFGELVRYTRKKHKIHPDDIGVLYGKIVGGSSVTGRHILRMEHNDNFFPKEPNRRCVLAILLRMPPELMAYLSLEVVISGPENPEIPLFPVSTKTIDTTEYYNTLRNYWVDGYPKGVEYATKDIKRRIYLLKDKVLFGVSLEKSLLTRLLCGYKILLADIAEDQDCYIEAEQYLTDAFTLASERECYDLQAIALLRRMTVFGYKCKGDSKAALGDFAIAEQLEHSIAPQVWGQMLTVASQSKAYLANDEATRLAALRRLREARDLAQPISTENFQFFVTFDKQSYFLSNAEACIASPIKKMRSPQNAEEYLQEAAKEATINGKSFDLGRQVSNDLVQARIYCDRECYSVAATTAENALVTMGRLQAKIGLNKIAALLAEIKEHNPLGIEVMSLECELMKVQQPHLFT